MLYSNIDMIGDATVRTNLNYTHLITVMCNMVDLYELIKDLREFLIFFPNLTIFKVPPKSL